MQRNMIKGLQASTYFNTHNFNFETKQLRKLFSQLSDDDKKNFNFDHMTIDWREYHKKGARQVRKLLLKEDESTLPLAKAKVQTLFYIDWMLQVGFLAVFSYFFIMIIGNAARFMGFK